MIRLTLATIATAGAAATVAWRFGGTLGTGVLAGYLLGAGLSGLGILYVRHTLLTRPEKSMGAMVVAFLFKLAALLIGALAFRYVEEAARLVDWRTFLVAFAFAAALLLPLGALDAARDLRRRTKPLEEGSA